jgi:hypothetical protein
MCGRSLVRLLLAAVALTLLAVSPAQARPWTTTYQWAGSGGAGYEGWRAEEFPAGDGQPGPWYFEYRGGSPLGPGLTVVPIGGRVYGNGNPASSEGGPAGRLVLDVPGASRFTAVRYGDARFRNQSEGQVFRLRLGVTPVEDTRDYHPEVGYPADQTHDLGDVSLSLPAGAVRTEIGLLTTCPGAVTPQQPPFACRTVSPASQTFGQARSVQLTLEDPDDPVVDVVAAPAIDGGYENRARPRTRTNAAGDASSGVRRIRVELDAGATHRTLLDRTVACDPDHRTAGRGALECPPEVQDTARDAGRDGGAATRTYTVTVTDFAGNATVRTLLVRRDLTPPSSASLTGKLTSRADAWTNLRSGVPVWLRATDGLSGVGRIELQADPQGPGRTRTLAAVAPDCSDGCRSVSVPATADLAQITRDGRYRLQVVATDRAGNRRVTRIATLLKIDRTPPRRCGGGATFTLGANRRVRVVFAGGSDPSPGAGVRRYVFAYSAKPSGNPAASTRRFFAVAADDTRAAPGERRFRGARTRSFEFRLEGSIDVRVPASLLTLDGAEGDSAPREVAGGEPGNVRACSARLLLSSGQTLLEDELERAWNLPAVERELRDTSTRIGREAVKRAALRTALKISLRFVSVGLGEVVSALVFADPTSCQSDTRYNGFNDRVRDTYAAAASAIGFASRVGVGGSSHASNLLESALRRMNNLQRAATEVIEAYHGEDCASPAKASLAITPELMTAAAESNNRISALDAQGERREAYKVALDAWREPRSGTQTCRTSSPRGWVIYWSLPPRFTRTALIPGTEAGVDYVGKSKALATRCSQYRNSKKPNPLGARERAREGTLATLDLPYLSDGNARRAEEALIAYFGPGPGRYAEQANGGGPIGSLFNDRHNFNPDTGAPYCRALLRGQYILLLNPKYKLFTAARYTRNTSCPGVGGPR